MKGYRAVNPSPRWVVFADDGGMGDGLIHTWMAEGCPAWLQCAGKKTPPGKVRYLGTQALSATDVTRLLAGRRTCRLSTAVCRPRRRSTACSRSSLSLGTRLTPDRRGARIIWGYAECSL